ncbi:MFS transporter [Haloplanus sp. GCM10025708]|uniref:MFS transporter n=1 Tax=Haloferacaceae TaxID=1644056 RepID=UPI00361946C3
MIGRNSRRWLFWTLLAVGFFFLSFYRVSSGVLVGELTQAFDATATELGLLHASFFYIYAALQLPAGLLTDRYGPRAVAGTGVLVMSVAAAGFAFAGSLAAGFLARALVGLGGSVLYVAILGFCANWFRADEFATMNGVTIAVAALGGVAATTPLALAVDVVGWRDAVLATAGCSALGGVAILAFVRDAPDGRDTGSAPDLRTVLSRSRTVVRRRDTWVLGGILFLVLGTNFTVLGLWGVPYIVHVYDASVARASAYVLAGNVGLLLGSPFMGWLSDRTASRTGIVVVSTAAFAAAYGLIAALGKPPLLAVGAILFGSTFVQGGIVLVYTVGKERHPAEAGGTISGAINSMGYAGAAVVPALMGGALDAFWTGAMVDGTRVYSLLGYRVAFGVAALAGGGAFALALFLHRRATR